MEYTQSMYKLDTYIYVPLGGYITGCTFKTKRFMKWMKIMLPKYKFLVYVRLKYVMELDFITIINLYANIRVVVNIQREREREVSCRRLDV